MKTRRKSKRRRKPLTVEANPNPVVVDVGPFYYTGAVVMYADWLQRRAREGKWAARVRVGRRMLYLFRCDDKGPEATLLWGREAVEHAPDFTPEVAAEFLSGGGWGSNIASPELLEAVKLLMAFHELTQ